MRHLQAEGGGGRTLCGLRSGYALPQPTQHQAGRNPLTLTGLENGGRSRGISCGRYRKREIPRHRAMLVDAASIAAQTRRVKDRLGGGGDREDIEERAGRVMAEVPAARASNPRARHRSKKRAHRRFPLFWRTFRHRGAWTYRSTRGGCSGYRNLSGRATMHASIGRHVPRGSRDARREQWRCAARVGRRCRGGGEERLDAYTAIRTGTDTSCQSLDTKCCRIRQSPRSRRA